MVPWEKQECDTEESYAFFLKYRNQGPGRKLYMPGARPQQVRDWHDQHGWKERVLAYDRHVDAEYVRTRTEKAAKAAESRDEDHQAILGDVRALVRLEVEKRVNEGLANPLTPTMTIAELNKLLDTAVKLERTQAGKPTDIVQMDLSGLTDDELQEAYRIARKAKGSG